MENSSTRLQAGMLTLDPAPIVCLHVKLGLYGIYAVGILDVDNIRINPTGGQPAPSVAISAPTNVRLVSGQ